MIDNLKVVQRLQDGLEDKLPLDHTIDTSSPIVALYGRNYSGKTAFLRMLATSIHNHSLATHGVNPILELRTDVRLPQATLGGVMGCTFGSLLDMVSDSDFQGKITDCELGVYTFVVRNHQLEQAWVSTEHCTPDSSTDVYSTFQRKFSDDHWYRLKEENVLGLLKFVAQHELAEIHYGKDFFGGEGAEFHEVFFNETVRDFLSNLRSNVNHALDAQDEWTYLHPTPDGRILYTLELGDIVSVRNSGEMQGHQRYTWFNPIVAPASSGKKLQSQYARLFEDVKRFFEEGYVERFCPVPEPNLKLEDMRLLKGDEVTAYQQRRKQEDWDRRYQVVEEDANLVITLDEPSAFLDPRNVIQFRDDLAQLSEQYDRLQIFLASNDIWLLQHLPDKTRYIDFYSTPIKSVTDLSLE
jgi:hypothetical protein